jgi:hypothetical protein
MTMKFKPEQYRAIAERWEKRAEEAPSHVSAEFLKLAARWRALATDAEQIETVRRLKEIAKRFARTS